MTAEWMKRLAGVCLKEGRVPEDLQEACVVPIYKGRCRNIRRINMLSILGKMFGMVVI